MSHNQQIRQGDGRGAPALLAAGRLGASGLTALWGPLLLLLVLLLLLLLRLLGLLLLRLLLLGLGSLQRFRLPLPILLGLDRLGVPEMRHHSHRQEWFQPNTTYKCSSCQTCQSINELVPPCTSPASGGIHRRGRLPGGLWDARLHALLRQRLPRPVHREEQPAARRPLGCAAPRAARGRQRQLDVVPRPQVKGIHEAGKAVFLQGRQGRAGRPG